MKRYKSAPKLRYPPIFIILLFLINCSEGIKKEENDDPIMATDFLKINLDFQENDNPEDIFNFIDSIEFIPIFDSLGSEMGEISKLLLFNGNYLIVDEISNSIFNVSPKGEILFSINSNNKDIKIPFSSIKNVYVDQINNQIIFEDKLSPNKYIFNNSGKFLKIEKRVLDAYNEIDVITDRDNIYKYSDYLMPDLPNTEKNGYKIKVFTNGSLKTSHLKYNREIIDGEDVFETSQNFFRSDNEILLTRPYDYNIYLVNSNGKLSKKLTFILPPENSIPMDFLVSAKYHGKRKEYTTMNKDIKYLITDVYTSNDILTFKAFGHNYSNIFFYDFSRDSLFNSASYLLNEKSSYLPFIGNKIHSMNDGHFLTSFSAATLIKEINHSLGIKDYLENLPQSLKYIYEKGNNQNPILVKLKLKK